MATKQFSADALPVLRKAISETSGEASALARVTKALALAGYTRAPKVEIAGQPGGTVRVYMWADSPFGDDLFLAVGPKYQPMIALRSELATAPANPGGSVATFSRRGELSPTAERAIAKGQAAGKVEGKAIEREEKAAEKAEERAEEREAEAAAPRRRGRPPGSKNKPRDTAPPAPRPAPPAPRPAPPAPRPVPPPPAPVAAPAASSGGLSDADFLAALQSAMKGG
jgi:hypothetical protein